MSATTCVRKPLITAALRTGDGRTRRVVQLEAHGCVRRSLVSSSDGVIELESLAGEQHQLRQDAEVNSTSRGRELENC